MEKNPKNTHKYIYTTDSLCCPPETQRGESTIQQQQQQQCLERSISIVTHGSAVTEEALCVQRNELQKEGQ